MRVVLAVDVGTSSIRITAYKVRDEHIIEKLACHSLQRASITENGGICSADEIGFEVDTCMVSVFLPSIMIPSLKFF